MCFLRLLTTTKINGYDVEINNEKLQQLGNMMLEVIYGD